MRQQISIRSVLHICLLHVKRTVISSDLLRIIIIKIICRYQCIICWKLEHTHQINGQIWCIAFNLLWTSDAIWRHCPGSTLAQILTCWLKALNHYLHYYWVLVREVLWHSPESNITTSAQVIILCNENHTFEVTATSPRGQSIICLTCWSKSSIYSADCSNTTLIKRDRIEIIVIKASECNFT